MSEFSKRLKEAAKKSGLSFGDIDEKLEAEAGSFERWVNGAETPDTETVNKLAEILGTDANTLLFGKSELSEMKAMFPNEAKPSPTPMSDWRFLAGVVMVFTGVVGILMLYMRYSAEALELDSLIDMIGAPALVFGIIAAIGLIVCTVTSIVSLHVPKNKKKENSDKDTGGKDLDE